MNMGYEEEELKPYVEPQPDLNDQKRIGKTGTVQQQRFLIVDQELNFLLPLLVPFSSDCFYFSSCNSFTRGFIQKNVL